MAVTYTAAAKTARMDAVRALIDVGTGTAGGVLKIRDSGNVVLAEFVLPATCGTAAAGVLTFDFDPDISDTTANASGTAANAIIVDRDDATVISGLTVGVAAADIILDSVSITAGQTVTIVTGTITHA